MEDINKVTVREDAILEKFDGDAKPENLFERIYITDGVIVRVEKFENGRLLEEE
jgi:hypothetical protein